MTVTVGAAVIDCLVDEGITTLFGIPGKQTLPMNEAVADRDDVEFVMARHETVVSHNAWGYAESSGEMAATVVIPGPGDMNAMNGLKNAFNDCTPLIHISVETEPEIRGGDGIHETPPDTYDNVVKENILVETPQSTVAELRQAIRIARTPPKGPVRIGIPKNFLPMDVELASTGDARPAAAPSAPDQAVSAAASLLADAERPVVVAGGGVRSAEAPAALRDVAERLDAPVVTTYKGKGTFPEDHPLSAGVLCGGSSTELQALLSNADAALGVGTDFDAVSTGKWSVDLPDDLVHVSLDASDIGIGYDPAVGIAADAAQTLSALADALANRAVRSEPGAERAGAVRESDRDRIADLQNTDESPLPSVAALDAVRTAAPRDAIVTADAGGSRVWTVVTFPVYDCRDYVNPGSWATMGSGLPSAIGAKLANPDQQVLTVVGDGGLMMSVHELHTLVAEDIDVTVVVLNNSDYAIISEEAERNYRLPTSEYGWTDAPLDFQTIADGIGLASQYAETPAELEAAVTDALESDGPTLVEVPTDPAEPQAGVRMTE
ncbi:thiamine pyrophosphate-binding protein [Natrinema salifodinae]|uniref:Acetolactate synthase-1/2/3 large subunit n=1 Tax=Natrinema salifodinae TaxID=1202768 RepID=A0A1I0LXB0_9EURY|nr:thiamine pyrophosphate-binding protein [Natrinema salifodinae]SEV80041.1 acetolactate synthase-1/2/3 large subunit [Natrinema salifodinae]